MKEREQKTAAQAADYLQGDRLEAERLTGVQTFMAIIVNVKLLFANLAV